MFGAELRSQRRGASSAGGERTLKTLLRVYAPEVLDLGPLLVDRSRRLRGDIASELERRFREGGLDSVRAYVTELERAQEGVELFRSELAAFIAQAFPLRQDDRRRGDPI